MEEIVTKFLIAGAFFALSFGIAATAAEARSYSYCLKSSIGPGDCKYSSYRQCQASASGVGGTCERNRGPRR